MTNQVHLIAEPMHEHSLARAIGHGHGKYAQWFNARHNVTGHLWAGRFFSTALDDPHLLAAVRYVEMNPVRAGLVEFAEDWKWSSAVAHTNSESDSLMSAGGELVERIADWRAWLREGLDDKTIARLRLMTQTGRPCGDNEFVARFEERLNRLLMPQKPGRKPNTVDMLTEDMFS